MSDDAGHYQAMPDLTEDEYAALKADIAEHGVLVPVEYDEHGRILDGHHRVRACRDLGIEDWPRITRTGMTEAEKRRHARVLNLNRRHLTRAQKRQLIADEVEADPDRSDRAIGRLLGVDHKTVGSVRRELAGEIPHPDEGDPDEDGGRLAETADEVRAELVQASWDALTDEQRAEVEHAVAYLRARTDALDNTIIEALGNWIAPATIIGWLTTAQHKLGSRMDDEGELLARLIIEPRIRMLIDRGEALAQELTGPEPHILVKPYTDEEMAEIERAISGAALIEPPGTEG